MSSGLPVLLQDHKILGSEYCSGYTDIFGKWNTGFYCPQSESKTAVSCCGTPNYKYCCIIKEPGDEGLLDSSTEGSEVSLAPYLIRTPIIFAAIAGVLLVVLVLILVTSCYFCSCCPCSKKRRAQIPPGLYRLPLASSSTTSALMNVYALSSPLDMEWNQIQQGFNAAAANGTHPAPVVHHNQLNNHIQHQPVNGSIRHSQPNGGNNRNGTIFTTQANGWLANSYNAQQQYPNSNMQPQPTANNNHSTLPRYFHYHQGNNLNRDTNVPPPVQQRTGYSNNSLGRPGRPPRIDSNNTPNPTTYYGFTLGNESRPYLISNGQLDTRPRSMISFRNNVAYITSTLPLTNSFRSENSNGGGPRRNVRFGGTTTMNPSNINNSNCTAAPNSNGAVENPIKPSNNNAVTTPTGVEPVSSECASGSSINVIPTDAEPCAPVSSPTANPSDSDNAAISDTEFKGPSTDEQSTTRPVSDTELTTSFGSSPVKTRVLLEEEKQTVAVATPPSNSLVCNHGVLDVDDSVISGSVSFSTSQDAIETRKILV